MLRKELQDKVEEIVKRVSETGYIRATVDLTTGNFVINGVEITLQDSQELVAHANYLNKDFIEIMRKVSNSNVGDKIRNNVKMTDKGFEVNLQSLIKELDLPLPSGKSLLDLNEIPDIPVTLNIPFPYPFGGADTMFDQMMKRKADLINEQEKSTDEVNKDKLIELLQRQVTELQAELEKAHKGQQTGLQFPKDFKVAKIPEYAPINPVTDEEIQQIISELEKTYVPLYQFVSHRLKDVIVIKMHDDEGITYIVADNYFYVNR